METLLLNLGATVGGFSGLVAMVLMIWFLRLQSAIQKNMENRSMADQELLDTLVQEIVSARHESNDIISANTEALTKVAILLAQLSDDLERHNRETTSMLTELSNYVRKGQIDKHSLDTRGSTSS